MGYALERDWVNAGISAAGAIPVVGDLAKAGRVGKKVLQELVDGGSGQAAKQEAKNTLQEQGKRQVSDSRNEFKEVQIVMKIWNRCHSQTTMEMHKGQGDFSRWGKRGAEAKRKR